MSVSIDSTYHGSLSQLLMLRISDGDDVDADDDGSLEILAMLSVAMSDSDDDDDLQSNQM